MSFLRARIPFLRAPPCDPRPRPGPPGATPLGSGCGGAQSGVAVADAEVESGRRGAGLTWSLQLWGKQL